MFYTGGICLKMESKLRLNPDKKKIICEIFKKHFGSEDHLWLFGSRVYPEKRGGDIDLYIETTESNPSRAIDKKLAFVNDLWLNIGEQKIDVIIRLLNNDFYLPIYDTAKNEGAQLV